MVDGVGVVDVLGSAPPEEDVEASAAVAPEMLPLAADRFDVGNKDRAFAAGVVAFEDCVGTVVETPGVEEEVTRLPPDVGKIAAAPVAPVGAVGKVDAALVADRKSVV